MLIIGTAGRLATAKEMAGPVPTSDLPSQTDSGVDITFTLTPPTGLTIQSGTYKIFADNGYDITQGGYPLAANIFNAVEAQVYEFVATGLYSNGQSFTYRKDITIE